MNSYVFQLYLAMVIQPGWTMISYGLLVSPDTIVLKNNSTGRGGGEVDKRD